MSATVLLPATTFNGTTTSMASTCTHCGHDGSTPKEAHLRIKDLEAQVRLLNSKAAGAVDKLADYEDEVRSLRAACTQLREQQQETRSPASKQRSTSEPQPSATLPPVAEQFPTPTPSTTPPVTTMIPNPSSPHRPAQPSRLASLSSFLPGRRRDTTILNSQPSTPLVGFFSQLQSSPQNHATTPPAPPAKNTPFSESFSSHQQHPPPLTLLSLQQTLENERHLRQQAESTLTQTQVEIEELTATLFGQANEMVAEERKARAKLEERVKVLEDRDGEKRKRLDRLEKALERIERVRVLVGSKKQEPEFPKRIEVENRKGGEEEEDGVLRVVNR